MFALRLFNYRSIDNNIILLGHKIGRSKQDTGMYKNEVYFQLYH